MRCVTRAASARAGGVLRGELERVHALGREREAAGGGVEGEHDAAGAVGLGGQVRQRDDQC